MPYTIRKEGSKFCVYKEGTDKSLGCHDTKDGAEKQVSAILAATHADGRSWWVSVEEMDDICPDCASKMRGLSMTRINLAQIREMPAEMLAGLCRKIGSDPGFYTTCMGASFGDFAPDKERFCAWLHKQCVGKWPAEKSVPLSDVLTVKMPSVGGVLESRIHSVFTQIADWLFGLGYINKEERLALSNAIGQGLDAYAAACNAMRLHERLISEEEALDLITYVRSASQLLSENVAAYGGALRALGRGLVEGCLVVFSPDGQPRDAYGNYFDAATDLCWSGEERRMVMYEHGMDPTIGVRALGDGWQKSRVDDVGLWVKTQLDLSDEYERAIYEIIEKYPGKMGLSSGTSEHVLVVDTDGRFARWPIIEGSFTVTPAEPRTRGQMHALREYKPVALRSLLDDGPIETARGSLETRPAGQRAHSTHNPHYNNQAGNRQKGKRTMNLEELIALIKSQLTLSEEDQAKLDAVLQAFMLGQGGSPEPEPEPLPEMPAEVASALTAQQLLKALRDAGFTVSVPQPTQPQPAPPAPTRRPPYNFDQPADGDAAARRAAEVLRSVHVMRHGQDIDEPTGVVMREIYGADYRQLMADQHVAFLRWMRTGREADILKRQLWSAEHVRSMLRNGLDVAAIRATMVEGMDELGGYAVPPQMQDTIISRVRGLTAVRGGGAIVVQTASNMIEWIQLTGGNSRYPTAMRGQWGDETTAGTADDFTMGLLQIPVYIYSYPVDFSRSLLEDAANLETIFTNLVADTLAMDEDDAFLIGDGTNKPRGILPGSANADSLTEVVSLDANTVTWSGLKALRRGIASQYRLMDRASWIGNSATGGIIEELQDGESRDYIDALVAGEQFPKLRGIWRESEALPDVSAGTYPLIYGDLTGYAIVERLGMSIDRFHDSNTGAKKYRFEVFRRLGGKIIESWKFAVQKIAAS